MNKPNYPIQHIIHHPSGEVIAVFTTPHGNPIPVRLKQIRAVWPGDVGVMTIETNSGVGYIITETIKDVYQMLKDFDCDKAYYGPDIWPGEETLEDGWPAWIVEE